MITLSLSLKSVSTGGRKRSFIFFLSLFFFSFFLNLKLCILSPSFLFDYTLWLVHGLKFRFLFSFFFSLSFFFLTLKRYVTRSSFSFVVCDFIFKFKFLQRAEQELFHLCHFSRAIWISKNRMILNNSNKVTITNMLSIDCYQNIEYFHRYHFILQ